MGLAFVPLYIKFMGIEAYGLVGFFNTLFLLFSILDLGLSATLNREMATRSGQIDEQQTCRDLLRTLETICWPTAVIVGLAVVILSFPLAKFWFKPEALKASDVQQAVMIMGLVVVLRWPFGLYQGGLMGLQRQVLVNVLNAVSGTFRGLGAVIVLWLVSPTIQAFFLWQIIISGMETVTSAFFLWRVLPLGKRAAKFDRSMLSDIWSFAVGMTGITVVATILTQADKVILSKVLPLQMYGYYMLAWTITGAMGKVTGPIFVALFPRFSQLVASRDSRGLTRIYHKSCQYMSVMVIPLAAILGLFSYEILWIWTCDSDIAAHTYLTLTFLVMGTACNSMMTIPYAVQLAYGWTALTFWVNVAAIVVLIPMLIMMVAFWGMIGGAIVWAALNFGYVSIAIGIMHKRILRGELWHWYLLDLGAPLAAALIASGLGRWLMPTQMATVATIIYLAAVYAASLIMADIAAPETRAVSKQVLTRVAESVA